jgi:phosphoadenosine phosphosulfate reductase
MRWCCTIFKTGPIYTLMQGFGNQKILTFYGIRRNESNRRSQYHKLSWNNPDHLGTVIQVEQDDEMNGVTIGAKIGQQATASPIIDWTEFDVWNYILSRNLTFNASYRLGYSRVGCWLCPLNSEWSELLASIFFPEDAARWRAQLIAFARRIGKPDPTEYVDSRAWAKRFGGAGLPNRFSGIAATPCGSQANTVQIEIDRPVTAELEAFLKPLGTINRDRSRPSLGEIYLEGRPNQDWDALIVQAPAGSTTLRFTVLHPKQDMQRLTWYFKQQATKFQTCIQCTACSAVCPHGAITIKPDMRVYEIDQDVCVGCMECVTHFGATGCLVAKSLSVYGRSKDVEVERKNTG